MSASASPITSQLELITCWDTRANLGYVPCIVSRGSFGDTRIVPPRRLRLVSKDTCDNRFAGRIMNSNQAIQRAEDCPDSDVSWRALHLKGRATLAVVRLLIRYRTCYQECVKYPNRCCQRAVLSINSQLVVPMRQTRFSAAILLKWGYQTVFLRARGLACGGPNGPWRGMNSHIQPWPQRTTTRLSTKATRPW